ncbi:CLUMA_CG016502, isoform A [Clunio marinus]|uniref:adenosine kinase n=1 Tax=Clunio marinus TaxID=568069 RepID=A0A1J1ISW2_9DIPT|nr:CLUMA_CG016502, isoform A [Clunio marinus]
MNFPQNNSILSINNNFYKILLKIHENKRNNQSYTKEIEWIKEQLLNENRNFCENAVNVLIDANDNGFALNTLVSTLSRLPSTNFEIVADGIFKILLNDLKFPNYKCPFGILQKAHPLLFLIDGSVERMLYFSQKIIKVLSHSNSVIQSNVVEFLRPVLLMLFCNDQIYSELTEVWRNIKYSSIKYEIISMRRTTSTTSCLIFNSMVLTILETAEDEKMIEILLLLVLSTKHLVTFSINPTENFEVILKHTDKIIKQPETSNIILILLAEILQETSIFHMSKLIKIFEMLIIKGKLGHPIILNMILDGLIQVLAYPSFSKGNLNSVEHLVNFINNNKVNSNIRTSMATSEIIYSSFDLLNARDISFMLESKENFNFRSITTEEEKIFWTRNHLVLRGLFFDDSIGSNTWTLILINLVNIAKDDDKLKSSIIMPLLFKLSSSTNPQIKIQILKNIAQLGATTEIFNTFKALSAKGIYRSISIDLHLRLWRAEPRTYPFLHKALAEKSKTDEHDSDLEIVRAAAINEICDLKPQHGPDLVSIISEILNNSLESKDGEIQAALAINSITVLCQNHVISIMSTWKEINLKTKYEKRPRIVKSLCQFFAIVPSLKRTNLEYENFMKEILGKLWYMIQWGNIYEIKYALEALKSWKQELLTLDIIPDIYREGIKLPVTPQGMEACILDMEVPGECFVQLLTKVHEEAIGSVGDLMRHYIAFEVSEFRSGHYLVKEGQPEPMNYKNLSKQSILKPLIAFVIQQVTTEKAEKIMDISILIEAFKVLSYKYCRPLPPLNWCFLHDLLHKSALLKRECLHIASKQSTISGTSKRLIENFLVNLDKSNESDVEIVLDVLIDLCNGVTVDIFRTFCHYIFKDFKAKDYEKKIGKCLEHEKDVTNRENLTTMLSTYMMYNKPGEDLIRLIPSMFLENLINGMITENLISGDDRHDFFKTFHLIFSTSESFPKKKWIAEFLISMQNRFVEKDLLDDDKKKFLLDIFCVAVIAISGNFKIYTSHGDAIEKRYQMFPQSLYLVSKQRSFDDIIGCETSSAKLWVFGNALLDVTVQIKNDELLRKYNLERNGQKEVSSEKLNKIIGDAKDRNKILKFSLGGSGLNSTRILAAMGQLDVIFFGAIGEDQNGKVVKEILKRSMVNARLQQRKDVRTGTCLCLCQGEDRSLTAYVGAAMKVDKSFIEESIKSLSSSLPALYYIEGFFIPEKMHICRFLHEKYQNSKLITNLNAPYIVKTFPKDISWLTKKADIVFGNRDEFEELASMNGFETMEDLLTDLLNEYNKPNEQKKIIVVTDGANPVFFYEGNSSQIQSDLVNVPQVDANEIIDTTGAGDSFVAGFIYALMEGKTTRECIEVGCEISAKVIRVIGCNLPKV